MSFMSQFLHFFGFGPYNDPADPLYADTAVGQPDIRPVASEHAEKPLEFDTAMQDAIFEKVVEVFNQSLPSFLAESVDRKAQQAFLRKSLDEGISRYIDSLNAAASARCEQQWQMRQAGLASELDSVRQRAEEVELRSKDLQQKQLSADRQKRALTERVHDLESQIGRLESEREQFELENRSLLNRLKVFDVHQADSARILEELNEAKAEIARLQSNPSVAADERVARLEEELARTGKELEQAIENADRRGKEVEELNELVAEFDAATARMENADRTISQMRENVADLERQLRERDAEIESLKNTIEDNIRRQTEREQILRAEIDELRPMTMIDTKIDFDEEDVMLRISDSDLSAISPVTGISQPVRPEISDYTPVEDDVPLSVAEPDDEPDDVPEDKSVPAVDDVFARGKGKKRRRGKRRDNGAGQPSARNNSPGSPEQLSLF